MRIANGFMRSDETVAKSTPYLTKRSQFTKTYRVAIAPNAITSAGAGAAPTTKESTHEDDIGGGHRCCRDDALREFRKRDCRK